MRYRYICDDCDYMVKDERDLDTKPNGTPCCPNCGSTHIDVYGFLYELESYDPRTKYIRLENGELRTYTTSEYLAHIKEVTK